MERNTRPIETGGTDSVVVAGDGDRARHLAHRMANRADVTFLSSDERAVAAARTDGIDAAAVDIADGRELASATARDDVAVVAADSDSRSFLVAVLLRSACGVETVVADVFDPSKRDLFSDAGILVVETQTTLLDEIDDSTDLVTTDA